MKFKGFADLLMWNSKKGGNAEGVVFITAFSLVALH